jgi:hypothetical protein
MDTTFDLSYQRTPESLGFPTATAVGLSLFGTFTPLAGLAAEEVFTAGASDHERRVFIAALCAAADPGGAVVVLGLRADFYAQVLRYPQLVATNLELIDKLGEQLYLSQLVERPPTTG